jgi:SAM-dependent methyltransferase
MNIKSLRKYKKLFQISPLDIFLCLVYKIFFNLLRFYFGFNRWHSSGTYWCRPYKREVVELSNLIKPNSVLEIGCGLGEIISRIDATHRQGIDIEPQVIDAARFLNRKNNYFNVGSLHDLSNIKLNADLPLDLLIMVNWTHEIEWKNLSKCVLQIIEKLKIKYILIDGIIEGADGYAYSRNSTDFLEWGFIQHEVVAADAVRKLYLIRTKISV